MQEKRKPDPKVDPVPRNITYPATAPDAIRPDNNAHIQNQLDVEALRKWSIVNKL